jgi:hypothetical protein
VFTLFILAIDSNKPIAHNHRSVDYVQNSQVIEPNEYTAEDP